MSSPSHITLSKSPRHLEQTIRRVTDPPTHRRRPATRAMGFSRLCQNRPDLCHAGPAGRKHAVLHAVQIPAVDGRHEAAGEEAEDDLRGKIVFAQSVAKLEVLIEHGAESEGN